MNQQFFQIALKLLAWWGNEGSNCTVKFFKFEQTNRSDSTRHIEYNAVFSKKALGGDAPLTKSCWIENSRAANLEYLLRMLLDKRPPKLKDSQIFLTPNPSWNKHEDSQWYKIQPIGVNTIGRWTKEAAEKMGITKKITN